MSGLSSVLDIARQAILANQTALQVTSNNIANVNTPGYSRQEVRLEAARPLAVGGNLLGAGVKVTEVRRLYDQSLNAQLDAALGQKGRAETMQGLLSRIEALVNESGAAGIGQALTDFFNAFQELAAAPGSYGARTNVQQQGMRLATQFRTSYETLTEIQRAANGAVVAAVTEINQLARQIGRLNSDIVAQEVNGQAAGLRDEREARVRELAGLVNITTFEDGSGNLNILIGNSRPLVTGGTVGNLSLSVRAAGTLLVQDVNLNDSNGLIGRITSEITAGDMGGYLEVRDSLIPSYKAALNDLAAFLIARVNGEHVQGYGLDGTTATTFFESLTPVDGPVTDTSTLSVVARSASGNANPAGASVVASRISSRSAVTGESYEVRFGFVIASGVNDTLRVVESGGSSAADTITLSANLNGQTGVALAAELQTRLNASATLNGTYEVAYDAAAGTFTITETSGGITLTLDPAQGTADETLGFTSAPGAAGSITSNSARREEALYSVAATSGSSDALVGTPNQAYTSGGVMSFAGISAVIASRADAFTIVSGVNDQLVVDAGAGPTTITLQAGAYTGSELATHLQTQLEAANGSDDTYGVTFNTATKRFTITNNGGSASPLTVSFAAASSTAAPLLGFAGATAVALAPGGSWTSELATSGPRAGDAFAIEAVRDAAANLAMNDTLLTNALAIAAAARPNAAGDNAVALEIGALNTARPMNDGTTTLHEAYGALVGNIGLTARGITQDLAFRQGIVEHLEQRREEVAGVSLEDEFMSLIKYQRSFEAAARLLGTVDRLLEVLLSI